ncbi:hypothetical protein RRG08_021786 [Elysia crispata]|uniref:Uncharacterized protein n=1 Tax=Elysia crispata TaxID=231223 RepID=A0AAE1DPN6_9GAST|nr:hypothetical protein RRG08_021786 [Elysia crispata]
MHNHQRWTAWSQRAHNNSAIWRLAPTRAKLCHSMVVSRKTGISLSKDNTVECELSMRMSLCQRAFSGVQAYCWYQLVLTNHDVIKDNRRRFHRLDGNRFFLQAQICSVNCFSRAQWN